MSKRRTHIGWTVILAVMACFVALRVVAHPVLLYPSEPGLIPLCSGGQVTYISISTGLPAETEHVLLTEPCPFFGVTSNLEGNQSELVSHFASAMRFASENYGDEVATLSFWLSQAAPPLRVPDLIASILRPFYQGQADAYPGFLQTEPDSAPRTPNIRTLTGSNRIRL